jgi:hypothetical protein
MCSLGNRSINAILNQIESYAHELIVGHRDRIGDRSLRLKCIRAAAGVASYNIATLSPMPEMSYSSDIQGEIKCAS